MWRDLPCAPSQWPSLCDGPCQCPSPALVSKGMYEANHSAQACWAAYTNAAAFWLEPAQAHKPVMRIPSGLVRVIDMLPEDSL